MNRVAAPPRRVCRAFSAEPPAPEMIPDMISGAPSGVNFLKRLASALLVAASHALLGFTAGVLLTIALRVIP